MLPFGKDSLGRLSPAADRDPIVEKRWPLPRSGSVAQNPRAESTASAAAIGVTEATRARSRENAGTDLIR